MPARRLLLIVALVGVVVGVLPSCSLLNKQVDVLLIGDSIMGQSGPFVEDLLRKQPALSDVDVQVEAVNGSGLLTPAIKDWQTAGPELAREYQPDITVILMVGNYSDTELWTGSDGLPVANDYSDVFYREWGIEATKLTEAIQATGSQVYWVLPPPFYSDEGRRRETLLRDTYVQLARDHPGVGLIDGRSSLGTGTGEFTWKLPSMDTGEEVAVRQGDSLHLTTDGGKLLARQMAQELSPALQQVRQSRATV
ncbi:MAG: hypothetical protein R2699_04685 [Acidimicrobiales bacterium]|nr:hypothetical protein [Acidimicrobiales bacterium]